MNSDDLRPNFLKKQLYIKQWSSYLISKISMYNNASSKGD